MLDFIYLHTAFFYSLVCRCFVSCCCLLQYN